MKLDKGLATQNLESIFDLSTRIAATRYFESKDLKENLTKLPSPYSYASAYERKIVQAKIPLKSLKITNIQRLNAFLARNSSVGNKTEDGD